MSVRLMQKKSPDLIHSADTSINDGNLYLNSVMKLYRRHVYVETHLCKRTILLKNVDGKLVLSPNNVINFLFSLTALSQM